MSEVDPMSGTRLAPFTPAGVSTHPERSLLAAGSCSIIHVDIDTTAHAIRKSAIPAGLRQKLESAIASPRPRS